MNKHLARYLAGLERDRAPDSFDCETCNGSGALRIGNNTDLWSRWSVCPTCQGRSRGMSADEYWKQLQDDADR